MDNDERKNLADFSASSALLVSDRPADLYSLIVTGSAAGQNLLYVYDGHNMSGTIKLRVHANQYDTVPIILKHPFVFQKGIYMAFFAGAGNISGQYCITR